MPKPDPKNTRNLQPAHQSKYGSLNQGATVNVDMADALETCDAQTLARALARVLGAGDAIIFSLTRDGGALCITVLEDDERHKLYCSSPRDIQEALDKLLV